jgi:hypothetical protein
MYIVCAKSSYCHHCWHSLIDDYPVLKNGGVSDYYFHFDALAAGVTLNAESKKCGIAEQIWTASSIA